MDPALHWAMLYQLGAAVVLQSVLVPPVFTGLEDMGPQYHYCILATFKWAVRSSLLISFPRKQYEGEGNPKPHADGYGIQGFPAPPLHPSCSLPDSLKWVTSSSLPQRIWLEMK